MGAPQKSFGEELMILRKKKKYTQKELATKLAVSEKTVSRWENDEFFPNYEMVKKIEGILAGSFTNSSPPIRSVILADESDQNSTFVRLSIAVVLIILGYIVMLTLRLLPYYETIVIEALFGFLFAVGLMALLAGIGLIINLIITKNRCHLAKLKALPYWVVIIVFLTFTGLTILL